MKLTPFEQWIKTLSDRSLMHQWVKYCAPTETGTLNATRAFVVYEEVMARRLLPEQFD